MDVVPLVWVVTPVERDIPALHRLVLTSLSRIWVLWANLSRAQPSQGGFVPISETTRARSEARFCRSTLQVASTRVQTHGPSRRTAEFRVSLTDPVATAMPLDAPRT